MTVAFLVKHRRRPSTYPGWQSYARSIASKACRPLKNDGRQRDEAVNRNARSTREADVSGSRRTIHLDNLLIRVLCRKRSFFG